VGSPEGAAAGAGAGVAAAGADSAAGNDSVAGADVDAPFLLPSAVTPDFVPAPLPEWLMPAELSGTSADPWAPAS